MTRSPPSARDAPVASAVAKRIMSAAVAVLALAGVVFTLWSTSRSRGESLSALPVGEIGCVGDDRGSSSYIIRPLEVPDVRAGQVILVAADSNVLQEFAVIDFAGQTGKYYLCPRYRAPVRIGSVSFTTRGGILATTYDNQAVYLFPDADLNAPPVIFDLPEADSLVRDNLYAVPDATGDKIWVVRSTSYETIVNLYNTDSDILNTMEMTGRYRPAGVLTHALVLKGRSGVVMLGEDGTVARLFDCPDRDDCPDVAAVYDNYVALLEESRTTTHPSGVFTKGFGDQGPVTEVIFGDLVVINVETGTQHTVPKPLSGSWYGDPALYEEAGGDFVRINYSPKFLMEFETGEGSGWRDWSQYVIDIRDQTYRLLRTGTGSADSKPRVFETNDQQYFFFTPYNRTLYKIDRETGNRIPLLTLPDRLDGYYVYDVL